jgi:hypothetical protein
MTAVGGSVKCGQRKDVVNLTFYLWWGENKSAGKPGTISEIFHRHVAARMAIHCLDAHGGRGRFERPTRDLISSSRVFYVWCLSGVPCKPGRPSLVRVTFAVLSLVFISRRKTPWKLSPTRKANARARLKKVDAVIEAVRASGVQCGSLVRPILCRCYFLRLPRNEPSNCQKSTRCRPRTNTPSSHHMLWATEKASIKCLNGLECVLGYYKIFIHQLTCIPDHAEDKSQRFLVA